MIDLLASASERNISEMVEELWGECQRRGPPDWQRRHLIVLTGRRNEDEWISDPQTVEGTAVTGRRAAPASLQPPTTHLFPTHRAHVFPVHRIISLHVNRVIPGWLGVLLEYLMCGLIYVPWLGCSIWMRSHSCVPEDAVNLSLCCQPILCYHVCSHPPVCPFHFVSLHRFSSYSSCGKDLQAEQVWAWNSGLS